MERVLVVDDDAELCQLVARFLVREGFHITWAPSGALGVERALAEEGVRGSGYLYASPAKQGAR